MEVAFTWHVTKVVEIPEEEVAAVANSSNDNLFLKNAFGELARKYNAVPEEADEIMGVFNGCTGEWPTFELSSDKFDEVIWEG